MQSIQMHQPHVVLAVILSIHTHHGEWRWCQGVKGVVLHRALASIGALEPATGACLPAQTSVKLFAVLIQLRSLLLSQAVHL